MSHANGQVKFKDGKIMHYEYNGTIDSAISHLYTTYEEMEANWRKSSWLECICGEDESVEIFTDYGSGFSWQGRACKKCCAITKGLSPYNYNVYKTMRDGIPEWLCKCEKSEPKDCPKKDKPCLIEKTK